MVCWTLVFSNLFRWLLSSWLTSYSERAHAQKHGWMMYKNMSAYRTLWFKFRQHSFFLIFIWNSVLLSQTCVPGENCRDHTDRASYNSSFPILGDAIWTAQEAQTQAIVLGYSVTNYYCHREKTFYSSRESNKMACITRDVDGHIGGAYKVGTKAWCESGCSSTRTGTYNYNLSIRLGP